MSQKSPFPLCSSGKYTWMWNTNLLLIINMISVEYRVIILVTIFILFKMVILVGIVVLNGHVQVGFDYAKGVSPSFFVRAAMVQICSFLLVSLPPTDNPNLVRRTRSEQMSELDIQPTNSDTGLDGLPVRFPGIPRCPNVPETPETRKPDSNRVLLHLHLRAFLM